MYLRILFMVILGVTLPLHVARTLHLLVILLLYVTSIAVCVSGVQYGEHPLYV